MFWDFLWIEIKNFFGIIIVFGGIIAFAIFCIISIYFLIKNKINNFKYHLNDGKRYKQYLDDHPEVRRRIQTRKRRRAIYEQGYSEGHNDEYHHVNGDY